MVFAVLFGTTVFLIHTDMPEGVQDSTRWLNTQHSGIATATALMPFAGISFLWFIGVVRDGFGRFEDRFFASVFLIRTNMPEGVQDSTRSRSGPAE